MKFVGFQKLTLLDYPGKVACTLFTLSCNFRCPFCHNGELIDNIKIYEVYEEEEILSYLQKRKGVLDGVCITGGEPLLNKDLPQFIAKVKLLGYSVKLDTNGSRPQELKYLVKNKLIDYVAMDIKNSFEKYKITSNASDEDIDSVKLSIKYLLEGQIDYEFRTTIVSEFHTAEDIETLAKEIKGAKRYFLQNFVDSEYVIEKNLHSVPFETLKKMKNNASRYINDVQLRGV